MLLLSRVIAALAYAGAAFLFGVALGERGELGVVQHVFMAVIPLATIVLIVIAKQGKAYVFVTGLAMIGGLLLGQRQFDRAWNECITRGDVVRVALLRHHAQHDGYPARLEELGIDLPCRAGFRRTILHYLGNERGFRLWMSNDREVVRFDKRVRSDPSPGAARHPLPASGARGHHPSPFSPPGGEKVPKADEGSRFSSSGKSSTPPPR